MNLKITPILAETVPLWSNKYEAVVERVKAILVEVELMERKDVTQLLIDENLLS